MRKDKEKPITNTQQKNQFNFKRQQIDENFFTTLETSLKNFPHKGIKINLSETNLSFQQFYYLSSIIKNNTDKIEKVTLTHNSFKDFFNIQQKIKDNLKESNTEISVSSSVKQDLKDFFSEINCISYGQNTQRKQKEKDAILFKDKVQSNSKLDEKSEIEQTTDSQKKIVVTSSSTSQDSKVVTFPNKTSVGGLKEKLKQLIDKITNPKSNPIDQLKSIELSKILLDKVKHELLNITEDDLNDTTTMGSSNDNNIDTFDSAGNA